MRWSFVLVLIAWRVAHADIDLAWHAPAGCPDEAAMRASIVHHLDAPPEQVELAVTVEIVSSAEGFVAHLSAGDEQRELTSASCSELADALAVIVARTAADHVAPPPPPAPSVPKPPPPPTEVVIAVSPTPRRLEWNAGVRVAVLAGNGVSPDADVAGEVAAWASFRQFRGELAVERWWATTAELASGAGVQVDLTAVAARVGWSPVRRVQTWLVAEVGSQHGMGIGFQDPSGGSGRWLAAGAGVGAYWPIAPHVAAVVAGELEVAIERTSFAVAGGTIYQTPRLAERLRLGLELSWF